tara:strand:+ start:100 stop:894 length:795 start_codon:yes stop_codon:yes gene_type:complete
MKLADFSKFINKGYWHFAKTMPTVPHWYVLRKNCDEKEFEDAVKFTREMGYDDYYYNKKYRAIDVGGYKYWTMGAPISETTLINRKKVTHQSYDLIAPVYDKMYKKEKFLNENNAVIERIAYEGGSVLDIGCGTGLLVDYIKPSSYLGIDPSLGMLARFKKRHGDKKYKTIPIRYEDWKSTRKFDYIVSLFGSPSYIPHKNLINLKDRLKKGGKMFLMFYKPKYVPYTYKKSDIYIPHFNYKKIPNCVEFHYNEYVINYYENNS